MIGAGHRDLAVLQRLAQRIQHARIELRQFVEEQHALMRQRDLAGLGAHAAAGQRRHAGGMMRRAERPPRGQRAVADFAGDGSDHRDFQQFRRRQRRQDRGQPRRQHRLAGAGRADHQQMMPAGRGDLERALGAFLALDVAQIEQRCLALVHLRLRPRQHLRAFEVVGDLDQRFRRDDLDIRARPGRFRAAGRRTDQALVARIGADRRRQHARDRRDRSVEPEFAEHGEAVERIRRDRADRRHQAERDRQIVMAAFLRQVGRREIDGDPARRQRQPRGDQRRAHPLARLGNRLVGQADDRERRQARRDLHLHVDRAGLDPLKGYGRNPLDHVAPLPQSKVAEPMDVSRTLREHCERVRRAMDKRLVQLLSEVAGGLVGPPGSLRPQSSIFIGSG